MIDVARTVMGPALLIGLLIVSSVRAAEEGPDLAPLPGDGRFAMHGQATYVYQQTNGFNAPYSGQNSLTPSQGRETLDVALFLGGRLWPGAEAWVNPEMDQGFGLSNTLGVAGFPSGAAYKVGAHEPYFRLQRAFIRQTFDLGGEPEAVQGVANQLQGSRSRDRWVFTVGKFAVTDVFDTNQFAHDPRNDFLNWAAIDAGTFDYAANDTLGVAVLDNRISGEFEEYLNLGGLGILVGDGKLPRPADERIAETYYSVAPLSWARISLDYQWVKHPAYNTQRGPVSILGIRVHAQF